MKTKNNVFVLILAFTIFFSCKKDNTEDNFRDPSKASCLLTEIDAEMDTTILSYNTESKVIKLEWTTDEYMEVSYDSEGKISRIDEYYPGNETYYTIYTWTEGRIEAVYYEKELEEWVANIKRVSELNGSNEVVKITDYTENTGWFESGDYFLFEWSNGNMIKAENWDNYSSPGNKNQNRTNKSASPFISAKSMYAKKRSVKSKKGDYNLYSTTVIEYDGKINPFRYLAIGSLIDPDEFNYSKNN